MGKDAGTIVPHISGPGIRAATKDATSRGDSQSKFLSAWQNGVNGECSHAAQLWQ